MGLFDFLKKSSEPKQSTQNLPGPYKDTALNLIYQLLFCDSIDLFKANASQPYSYPFDILFSAASTTVDLKKIVDDSGSDPRTRILAYNRLLASGQQPTRKELLAVIVEVSMNEGLDVLASFSDGTARYINHTGRLLVWEATDDATANELKNDLFARSQQIVERIGPWDKPRPSHPVKGNTRISFLVSDGLYFGEGQTNYFFKDQLAEPALTSATRLMQYLTEKQLADSSNR